MNRAAMAEAVSASVGVAVNPDPRILVIGAGPTGLGAAYRLHELGYDRWELLEANDYVGGLATSFTNEDGFTFDIGGHVMFSHYPYYDKVVERLLGADYAEISREAWVWIEGRFVPYPFQNNIKGLEPQTVLECVIGLIEAQRTTQSPANFKEWVEAIFGAGIARHFMLPYNFKVWATPPELMSYQWIGERVSVVDVERVLRNVILGEADASWGPNSTFRYPLRGGTGFLYNRLRPVLGDRLHLRIPAVSVDPVAKQVRSGDGRTWGYDALLSTMPLNRLVGMTEGAPGIVREAAQALVWSGSHIVGVGVDREADSTKSWIYFPEPEVPFYRVTYLSNYSPHMTAKPGQTSLLTETSHSAHKPEDPDTIVTRVMDGLVATGLLHDADRGRVVTTWSCSVDMTYPVPSLRRDGALSTIQPWLRSHDIWSRGRFGAWLYEIGNMDHSFMQGVEFVDHVLRGEPETVWIPRGEEGRVGEQEVVPARDAGGSGGRSVQRFPDIGQSNPGSGTPRPRRGAARVGHNVRRMREELGMSLQQLAIASDIAPATLARLEEGTLEPPLATLSAVAVALGSSVPDLLTDPPGSDDGPFPRPPRRSFRSLPAVREDGGGSVSGPEDGEP